MVHVGGFVLDVINKGIQHQLDIAVNKLTHKTRESVKKGIQTIAAIASIPPKNETKVRWYNKVYNYVSSKYQEFAEEYPKIVAGLEVGVISAASVGAIWFKNRIQRAFMNRDAKELIKPPSQKSLTKAGLEFFFGLMKPVTGAYNHKVMYSAFNKKLKRYIQLQRHAAKQHEEVGGKGSYLSVLPYTAAAGAISYLGAKALEKGYHFAQDRYNARIEDIYRNDITKLPEWREANLWTS